MSRSALRTFVLPLVLAAGLVCGGPAGAQAQVYVLDPVHTRVMFAVDHAGFSKAIGTASGSRGVLLFDPDDWRTAWIEVQVPVAALDLGDDRWNRATLARNLLDAERHPLAYFVSERVEPLAADRAAVHGMLTLRGVSRPVTLEVALNAHKRHPLPPFRRTAGFSATATLSRSAFGIDAWRSVIGDAITLRIEAEATRARGGLERNRAMLAAPSDDGESGDGAAPDADAPVSFDDLPPPPPPPLPLPLPPEPEPEPEQDPGT